MIPGVLQIVDTLEIGGAERMAVNLASYLPPDRYRSAICATRAGGPLAAEARGDIPIVLLNRRGRYDPSAILRMRGFIHRFGAAYLHAHGSSLFIARMAAMFNPGIRVIWHAHSGRLARRAGTWSPWGVGIRGVHAVITVSRDLARWVNEELGFPSERIHVLPNFVVPMRSPKAPELPGAPGRRIVCVANVRPEKGIDTLLSAMAIVRQEEPLAHLLIAGRCEISPYSESLRTVIKDRDLTNSVTFLGERRDIAGILAGCDIAVLSSRSEGLPMALLEYGAAGLPVICTRVGQCAEVIDNGKAGLLVDPEDPHGLAQALLWLLRGPEFRSDLARRFARQVRLKYSPEAAISVLSSIYEHYAVSRC